MATLLQFFGMGLLLTLQGSLVTSVDSNFLDFFKIVSPNMDTIILTLNPVPIIVERSFVGRQFVIYNTTEVSKALTTAESWRKLTYLAEFGDVPSTVSFVTEFNSQTATLRPNWELWRLVIFWPENVPEADRSVALRSSVGTIPNITNSFKISSSFFIVFPNTVEDVNSVNVEVRKPFGFYEIYGMEGNLVIKEIGDLGNISPGCNLCPPWTGRRLDFYGTELSVGAIQDPESANDTNYVRDPTTGAVRLTTGFSVEQFHMLQQALNFTYRVKIWNASIANETGEISAWDGMVAAAETGEIDYGVSVSVYMQRRSERVSMLPPSDEYVVSAFFRPPTLNSVRDIFTQPFQVDLWLAVVTTWLILSFSMILFSAIRQRVGAEAEPGVDEPDFTQNSLIWAVATACQQGWDEHPVSISMRLIFIAGSFTAVIAYAGYSAAIVSTLSLKVEAIKSSDDLIYNGFTMGLRSGYLDIYLANNKTNDGVTRIYNYIRKFRKNARVDVQTGATRLINSHDTYAFVCVRDAFYDIVSGNLTDKDICGIQDMPVMEQSIPVGSFTSRNSPYKQFFRVILLRIRERGVLWRMKDFYLYTRRCLVSEGSNEGQALGFNDVFTAFMILIGGYVLSTTFLGMETVFYRKTMTYLE